MKLRPIILMIIATLSLIFLFFSPASSMDDPGFVINRMVISEIIADNEPVAMADAFSTETERVFCFLEAKAIEFDTTVSFVWYFENKEMARVSLPLKKGRRWRTYSSKKIAGLTGNWTVELQESSGIVLNSISFKVQ